MSLVYAIAGLALLFVGGEVLVRGAVALAERLSISPAVIGLTIVAMGTSAPELTVTLAAGLRGADGIAIGGVVGSNIANILLVLGITAMIQPIVTDRRLVRRDGFFMLAVTFGFAAIAVVGEINRVQGLVMVTLLALYVAYSYWAEVVAQGPEVVRREAETAEYRSVGATFATAFPMLAGGLTGVVVGADLLVTGAVDLARAMGVSEAVIGLSMVAFGTSVPELAISALAAFRGHAEVAVGNLIGSNIFNLLGIFGVTGIVVPLTIPAEVIAYDVWVMAIAASVLIPVMLTGHRVSRLEGGAFLAAYLAYVVMLYLGVPYWLAGWIA